MDKADEIPLNTWALVYTSLLKQTSVLVVCKYDVSLLCG